MNRFNFADSVSGTFKELIKSSIAMSVKKGNDLMEKGKVLEEVDSVQQRLRAEKKFDGKYADKYVNNADEYVNNASEYVNKAKSGGLSALSDDEILEMLREANENYENHGVYGSKDFSNRWGTTAQLFTANDNSQAFTNTNHPGGEANSRLNPTIGVINGTNKSTERPIFPSNDITRGVINGTNKRSGRPIFPSNDITGGNNNGTN